MTSREAAGFESIAQRKQIAVAFVPILILVVGRE